MESLVFLSMVRSAFRLCARGVRDPAVALALTNDFIAREELDCFAVFSYAIIDPEDRTLRVATAGFRPSGLLRERGRAVPCADARRPVARPPVQQ